MSSDLFPKGIKYLTAAVKADHEEKHEEALRLYVLSMQYFLTGLKYSKNQRVNAIVRDKVTEFLARAEVLKKEIDAVKGKSKDASGPASQKVEGGGPAPQLTEEELRLRRSLEDTILKEKPQITMKDVAGLETAKRALEEAVILPQKFPQLFTGKRKAWKGILLYGPPGTGKSLLAKAAAGMTNSTYYSISSSSLVSKWMGESEKLIRELFRMAQESKPSIIFIDEIDAICGARSDDENDATRRIKTEFLVQMQKVLDTDGTIVLAATNRPYDLDPAVRRRFEKRIYIPLPDLPAREAIVQIHLGDEPMKDIDPELFKRLARITEGYSGSDLAVVARDSLMAPVRDALHSTHWKQVPNPHPEKGGPAQMYTPCSPGDPGAIEKSLMELTGGEVLLPPMKEIHFEKALRNTKPSVSKADLEMQERFTKQFGIPQLVAETPEERAAEIEKEKKQQEEEREKREKEESQFMKKVNEWTTKAEDKKKEEKKKKRDTRQAALG